MQSALKWLITIEDRAERLYNDASAALADDSELSEFLLSLSRDEHSHEETMTKAAALIGSYEGVTLTEQTRACVDLQFDECEELLASGRLSVESMAAFLEQTECSEWNDFYLFVLKTVIHDHKEFIPFAKELQRHKNRIERFLEGRGYKNERFERLKRLKALWNEHFLVVDDEPMITDVLSVFLEDDGKVDCASNGAEALEKLSQRYYAVIICDIDMPVMDGMEFYEKSVAAFPNIGKRFLFHTGMLDAKRKAFFARNNLAFIQKPADLSVIRGAISAILGDCTRPALRDTADPRRHA